MPLENAAKLNEPYISESSAENDTPKSRRTRLKSVLSATKRDGKTPNAKETEEKSEPEKRKKAYLEHVTDHKDLYGFLSHENPLYHQLRGILDKVLRAADTDPNSIQFDCILDPQPNAHVFPEFNHVFLLLGTILSDKLSKDATADTIAAILAHEVAHLKFKNTDRKARKGPEAKLQNHALMREEERLADIEATEILNRAGFNPSAMADYFQNRVDEEKTDDYLDFAMGGVTGLVYNAHEQREQRVAYLKAHIQGHLFKNRDKTQELIPKGEIDLKSERFGFLFLLRAKRIPDAISSIRKPWQLAYILHFLRRHNLEEVFSTDIQDLKESMFFPTLKGFNPDEKQLLWDLLTSDTDFGIDEIEKIRTTQKINVAKLILHLPELFPKDSLQYLYPLGDSGFTGSDDFYSPLEKVMDYLTKSDSIKKTAAACFPAWEKERPEWIANFIDSMSSSLTQCEQRPSIYIDLIPDMEADLLSGVLASPITFNNRQKISVFKLLTRSKQGILGKGHPNRWKLIDQFMKRHLCDEKPEHGHSQYIEAKTEFLKTLFSSDKPSETTGNFMIARNTRLLASNRIDSHRRNLLLGLGDHLSIDAVTNETEYRSKKRHISLPKDPTPFPWQILTRTQNEEGSEDDSDEQELGVDPLDRNSTDVEDEDEDEFLAGEPLPDNALSSGEPITPLSEDLESWMVNPNQFWTLVVSLSKPSNFETLLRSDIPAETLANFIQYRTKWTRGKLWLGFLDRLSTNHPKAKRVADLVRLAQSPLWDSLEFSASDLSALPAIPERNFLLVRMIESSTDKRATYEKTKPFFYQEDRATLEKRLDQDYENGTFHAKLFELLTTEDLNAAYAEIILGPSNHCMDEAAHLAWGEAKESPEFTNLPSDRKIQFIKDLFPEVSIRREEALLSSIEADSEADLLILLGHLNLPIFRYRVGDRLWKAKQNALGQSPIEDRIHALCQCYPEASPYRDQLIESLLQGLSCSRSSIPAIEALLYSANPLNHADPAHIYHLHAFRTLTQLIYFAHADGKSLIFSRLIKANEEHGGNAYRAYLTHYEQQEVMKAFFEGPQSAVDHSNFRISLESLFLEKTFSKDITQKLTAMRRIESELESSQKKRAREIDDINSLSSEERESNEYNDDLHLNAKLDALNRFQKNISRLTLKDFGDQTLDSLKKISSKRIVDPESLEVQDNFIEDSGNSGTILLGRQYLKCLKASIPQDLFTKFPTIQNLFFSLVKTLPKEAQAHTLSRFLVDALSEKSKGLSDLIVAFLESMGVVYIKAGQLLASLGYFDKELQIKLLRLTSSVEPISVLRIWHILREEFGDRIDLFEALGPLLGSASIRQVHKVRLKSGEERILKVKKPQAVHSIRDGLDSLQKFIAATRTNSRLLQGVVIPEDIVSELSKTIEKEVLSCGDQGDQNDFHALYEGTQVAEKKLYIPTVDPTLSTGIVTIETEAPGTPLSHNPERLSDETKRGLLDFFLRLIFEKGKYHADPHPGNILENPKSISLVDFGMMATLSPTNHHQFFTLIQNLLGEDFPKMLETLITCHLSSKGSLEAIDLATIRQELDFLLKSSMESGESFQDISLKLLNTLENLKLALPSEIKILIKTVSQMGYLIEGQEGFLLQKLDQLIASHGSGDRESELAPLRRQAQAFIAKNTEKDDGILRIAKGSLVRKADRPENVWEIAKNIALDPKQAKGLLMLELTDLKVAILPNKRNYEVFRGGRWVSVEELVFGPKK